MLGALQDSVNRILNSSTAPMQYSYEAFIHVKATNKTHQVPKVVQLDVFRDYLNNYSDKTIIKVMLTGGVWAKQIYPHAKGLELTLIRTPFFNLDGRRGKHASVERYTATLINHDSPNTNLSKNAIDEEVLDLANLVEIELELISKTAEEIGLISCGGVARQTTNVAFLRAVLNNEACQQLGDANITVRGVDIVEPIKALEREHIVIPHGTRLVDLPNYLQQKCGGIYPSGLGYYLQDRYWYVYPAFDYARLKDTERVITFVVVPPDSYPGVERTFAYNDRQLSALVTAGMVVANPTHAIDRSLGNGVNFTTASSLLKNMSEAGANKVTFSRANANTETQTTTRSDNKVFIRQSNKPITDNSYAEFSKIAARSAATVTLVWDYSEAHAIVPGTMAKVYYLDDKVVKSMVGVISAVHHYSYLIGKGYSNLRYGTSSAVQIKVDAGNLPKPTNS